MAAMRDRAAGGASSAVRAAGTGSGPAFSLKPIPIAISTSVTIVKKSQP